MTSSPAKPGGRREDRLTLAAVLILALHAAVAVTLGLGAYADGAWFDFALAVGRPFELVWRNYPARLTHYLAIYLPAWGLVKLNAPLALGFVLADAIWFFAPAASLQLCRALLPPGRRDLALVPAGYFVLVALLTWGFPTETWLLAAFAWPAFVALAYGRGAWAAALGAGLSAAAILSYEAGPLLAPLLLWAGLGRSGEGAAPMKIAAVAGVALGLAAFACAAVALQPSARISADLAYNVHSVLSPEGVLQDPSVRKYALLAALASAGALTASAAPRLRVPILGLLVAVGAAIALGDVGGYMAARYPARSICVVALPLAMFLWLWSRRRPLPEPPPKAALDFALAAAVLMAAAVTTDNLKFALSWRAYDRAVVAVADCAGPTCDPAVAAELPLETTHSPAAWGWGLPFHSLVRSADPLKARLVVEPWPVPSRRQPLDCADARRLDWRGARPPALQSLVRWACSRP